MKRLGIVGSLALVIAVACGGQPAAQPSASTQSSSSAQSSGAKKPTTPAEIAAYQGSDREQLLIDGAKKEGGTLSWYTSLAGDIIDLQANAFKKKYPFVTKVDIFRGAEDALVTKAAQQAQANQPAFDVIESQITAVLQLFDAKILTPFYSPAADKVPDQFKTAASGKLLESATDRVSLIAFGYNTNLIKEGDVPKSFEDLLKPAFTGKLAVAGSTTGKRWVGAVLHKMGEDKGLEYLKKLGTDQKVSVQQVSGKALLDLIAKGEIAASPTIFKDHADLAAKQKNAPVKWVPLDTVIGNTGQVAVALKAEHPYTAMLFIDFLLGSDGAKVFHDNEYVVSTDSLPFDIWVPEHGKTLDQISKDTKHWNDVFSSVFR